MEYLAFSAPKIGLGADANEDAFSIKTLSKRKILVSVADGASTGVFSRQWSNHIVAGIDVPSLASPESFLSCLGNIRATFKPDIIRPSAQRKFLLEGSYATVTAIVLEKTGWLFPRLYLRFFSVGDVNLLVFDAQGHLRFSHPYSSADQFGNAPDLVRSGEKLQDKTPLILKNGSYVAAPDDMLAVVSDALGELIFRHMSIAGGVLKKISACANDAEFANLIAVFHEQLQMKNDDATVLLMTENLQKYFEGI